MEWRFAGVQRLQPFYMESRCFDLEDIFILPWLILFAGLLLDDIDLDIYFQASFRTSLIYSVKYVLLLKCMILVGSKM